MILLINACVRTDSRTKRLTDALLKELDGDVTEILDRVKAMTGLRYDGYLDETADSTLFIIRTEAV